MSLHGQFLSFYQWLHERNFSRKSRPSMLDQRKSWTIRKCSGTYWLWLGLGCGSSWLAAPVLELRPPSTTRPYLLVWKGLLREEGQQGHRQWQRQRLTRKSTNNKRRATRGKLGEASCALWAMQCLAKTHSCAGQRCAQRCAQAVNSHFHVYSTHVPSWNV